jgi:hypothetical protein
MQENESDAMWKNASLTEEFTKFTPTEFGRLIDPGTIENCD